MCRSIITLRGPSPASDEEVRSAALQFVRKISGYRQPSRANQQAFEQAVEEVTISVRHLLDELPPSARERPVRPVAARADQAR